MGRTTRFFCSVNSVTDGNGNKLKYESSTANGFRKLKIYIPGAVDTTRTVEITYTLRNAVRFFDDHDEFYWNVTGNDWPVPIDHASAFVCASACGRRFTAGAGFHRRLWLGGARRHCRSQRRRCHLRDQQSASHARRIDD